MNVRLKIATTMLFFVIAVVITIFHAKAEPQDCCAKLKICLICKHRTTVGSHSFCKAMYKLNKAKIINEKQNWLKAHPTDKVAIARKQNIEVKNNQKEYYSEVCKRLKPFELYEIAVIPP